MSITLSRTADAPPAGTGTGQRYAAPTAVTDPAAVLPEPAEPRAWFTVPADGTDGAGRSSTICALCSGTGRLADGSGCPGSVELGPPVAWVAIEETDAAGHWDVVHEGIRDLHSKDATQAAVDHLLDLLVDEERPGRRYAWRRYSVLAPDASGRAVVAYREVPPRTNDGWVYPPLSESLVASARKAADANDS